MLDKRHEKKLHFLAKRVDALNWKQVTKYLQACWQFTGVSKPQMTQQQKRKF
jgi:hypothetical protein